LDFAPSTGRGGGEIDVGRIRFRFNQKRHPRGENFQLFFQKKRRGSDRRTEVVRGRPRMETKVN